MAQLLPCHQWKVGVSMGPSGWSGLVHQFPAGIYMNLLQFSHRSHFMICGILELVVASSLFITSIC